MNLKTKNEFENWMFLYGEKSPSSYDKKLLNLVYSNLEELSSRGLMGKNKRSDLLVDLIKKNKDKVDEISFNRSNEETSVFKYPFNYIHSIEVESFRGFINNDKFEFSKKYNLIFGQNGSGKSSLFEAMEYALLGDIEEASQRRIPLIKYIINATTGKSIKPKVYALDEIGSKVLIESNQKEYQWIFIEKNRINSLSRVPANTDTKQTEIISNLFGLEDFNEFVRNFTPNFSIPREVENAKKLEILKQDFASNEQTIKNEEESLSRNIIDKQKLYEEYKGSAYCDETINDDDELLNRLNGDQTQQGRILQLTEIISGKKSSLDFNSEIIDEIKEHKNKCLVFIQNFNEKKEAYIKQLDKINLRDLYEAAIKVENEIKDKCPLCDTPIKGFIRHTKINPYKNAKSQLALLTDIDILKHDKKDYFDKLIKELDLLDRKIIKVNSAQIGLNISVNLQSLDRSSEEGVNEIEKMLKDESGWDVKLLDSISSKIKEMMDVVNAQASDMAKYQDEFDFLSRILNSINKYNILIDNIKNRINLAREANINFNDANKDLIVKVAEDEKINIIYDEYEKSYEKLMNDIRQFRDNLPVTLIAGLNGKVAEYFNIINDHENDRKFEQIDKIELPAKSGDSIVIYFKDNPEKKENALHILSEGHLKCLGLAIIIAKAVFENVPLLIFDDVVNAIDDDHRDGVRDLLFKHADINQRQIILTSHGETFIEQIVNEIKKNNGQEDFAEINFILSDEKGIKSIKNTTRHFLENAEDAINSGRNIDCMRACRFALPSIMSKLWAKIRNKNQDHLITIQQRYKTSPDLRSIVDGLNKKCKEIQKNTAIDFKNIPDLLMILFEQNNWNTLNVCSHYQDANEEKVEMKTVRIVFDSIKQLSEVVDSF